MGKLEKRCGPSLPDIWKVYESRSKHINIREMCAEILARGAGKVHTIETEQKMYKKDTGSMKNLILDSHCTVRQQVLGFWLHTLDNRHTVGIGFN